MPVPPGRVVGIGVDLVDVGRFRQALRRTPSLAERLFTPGERSYASAARDPAERYAVRFAAKEAVLKSLGVGIGAIDWHDVEIVRQPSGAPSLRVSGRAQLLAEAHGVTSWLVSLSHIATVAHAVVAATA